MQNKTTKTLWLALACGGLLTQGACVPSAKLTRRYSNRTMNPAVAVPDVAAPSVNAFVLEVPKETPQVTVKDLAAEGQAALITELGRLSKDAGDLLQNLGRPVRPVVSPTGTIDDTKRKKRVVISVTNNARIPGTRLQRMDVTLGNLKNARFVQWNHFVTEFATIDLGSMGSEQNRSVSATSTADPRGPLFGTQTLSGTASGKLTEAILLKERYVKTSGILRSTEATIIQQGVPGFDLTGNTTVDVEFQLDGAKGTAPQFLTGGTPQALTLTKVLRIFAKEPKSVSATVSYCAEIRAITTRDNSLAEGDDHAVYTRTCETGDGLILLDAGSAQAANEDLPKGSVSILTPDEMRAVSWTLRHRTYGAVHIAVNEAERGRLDFYAESDAEKALDSLLASTSEQNLRLGGRELYFSEGTTRRPVRLEEARELMIQSEKLN